MASRRKDKNIVGKGPSIPPPPPKAKAPITDVVPARPPAKPPADNKPAAVTSQPPVVDKGITEPVPNSVHGEGGGRRPPATETTRYTAPKDGAMSKPLAGVKELTGSSSNEEKKKKPGSKKRNL